MPPRNLYLQHFLHGRLAAIIIDVEPPHADTAVVGHPLSHAGVLVCRWADCKSGRWVVGINRWEGAWWRLAGA